MLVRPVILIVAFATRALADAPAGDPPWAKDIPEDKRQAASVEYAAGNEAWSQSRYTEALARTSARSRCGTIHRFSSTPRCV
jgi:hypothetical protein